MTLADIVKKLAVFVFIGYPPRFCIWKVRAFSFVMHSKADEDYYLSSSSSFSLTTTACGFRKPLKLVPRF